MTRTINVALVGSKFMGRAHSNAWLNVSRFFDCDPRPVMHTVIGRNADELTAFAERWGWLDATVDWRGGVTDDAVDLVDIGTPNNVHAEQAIAALEAGKHVACRHPPHDLEQHGRINFGTGNVRSADGVAVHR